MSSRLRSAVDGHLIVSGEAFHTCVAVQASADVSADVTFQDGTTITGYPLTKGQNNIQIKNAVFTGATLVALYN
jgi:serine acetyltransferase